MAKDFDFVVAPGDYIEEWIDDNGWTQAELARHLDCTRKHVHTLIAGSSPITPDYARRLERVTGTPADRWMQLETFYRAELERLELARDPSLAKEVLSKFPLSLLRSKGHITSTLRQPARCATEVMSFYRVGNLAALDNLHTRASNAVAFRQAKSLDGIARATWLRLVEIEAADGSPDSEFDRDALVELVPAFRSLVRQLPDDFGETLVRKLGDVGVQIVFVESVPRAGTYGAARWFDGRPLVALSLHRRSEDQFWFTFFHELFHVTHHELSPDGFVSGETDDGLQEREANQFAGELLIPPSQAAKLKQLRTLQDVRAFAEDIDMAPGVVVARLQRDKIWDYTQGHALMRKLTIIDEGTR